MRVGNGLKQRHVDRYLSVVTTQILPGESVKGMFRVLNIRPNLASFAVTEIRIMLVDGANRYFGHIPYYDLDQWGYDPRKMSFTVVLHDGSGLVLKGIEADDGVFLTDYLTDAKELPHSDERFVALARRDQRTDIDHTPKSPGEPAAAPDAAAGAGGAVRAGRPQAAAPGTDEDEFDFFSLDEPAEAGPAAGSAGGTPTPAAAPEDSVVDRLERLSDMLAKGLLTEEEFAVLKRRLLEA